MFQYITMHYSVIQSKPMYYSLFRSITMYYSSRKWTAVQ